MSQPGWYPDPGGAHGRYRYWNGSSWSSETTSDPRATPAPGLSPTDPPAGPRGRSTRWVVGVVLVVVAALVAWFVTRSTGPSAAPEDTSTATPTVSAWNETSTPSASGTPPDQPPGAASLVDCPVSPLVTLPHTADGRLHGGHLSVEKLPAPWFDDFTGFVNWSVDTSGQLLEIVPGWVSNSAVGALLTSDGFTSPKQAAYAFLSCYATSSYYRGFTGRSDVVSQAVSVDGHPGWHLRSQVRVVYPEDPSITGDVVDIIVVDTGDPRMLSYWEGNATIGDQPVQRQIDQVAASLTVGD
ncbi:MAG TPA: DUF2510 domain-containing protein [Propionibacteriaceae bacterium]|nr:DUF2510 domain-containing protein [Propionibacteriaceae bacterium]